VQNKMNDNGGEKNNAEDNNQRVVGVISMPKAAMCEINSCITSSVHPAVMMTAGCIMQIRRRQCGL
jgi:hypothetical protein